MAKSKKDGEIVRLRQAIQTARNAMNCDMAEDDVRAHGRVLGQVDSILRDAVGQASGPPEVASA